ncbi:MAG: hypothetical protein EA379_09955 [Phycisphaerales bacterium]|nr:MAG: hypothetical protein EA379_09955 [Phycisphaerales bacterium]
MRTILALIAVPLTMLALAPHAHALDEDRRATAQRMAERATAYLRAQQDAETGGWAISRTGPTFPAITALVITGMLHDPAIGADDPTVSRAVDFLLSHQQPDGGVYDRILPSYNTSIVLSALALVDREDARAAIRPAQDFLRSLQWSEDAGDLDGTPEAPSRVGKDHPFYGGIGYGRHGRPDLSNLSIALQGLHDSGLPADDPAFERALVFLSRVQMQGDVNDMPYAEGSTQGGFIYATGPNADNPTQGQTMAKETYIEETLSDGRRVSRLRAYGSMTYAGFKSLIYAGLQRDDPRVAAAYEWIRRHYTLAENPEMGNEGRYYYFTTFSRAMQAWGEPTITPVGPDGEAAPPRDWAADLVDALAPMQQEDGSFPSLDDRWMEGNDVLITAYALLALQHAMK